jgi:AcrR family transcriptional regulator
MRRVVVQGDDRNVARPAPNVAMLGLSAWTGSIGLLALAGGACSSPGPETVAAIGRRYGGQTVGERRSARRRRLVAAGLELFSTDGYTATTIEDLCSSAQVTARHFYEEFGSREDLLRAVFDQAVATTIGEVVRTYSEAGIDPDDLEASLGGAVHAFIHAFLADPRRARVVCIESVRVSQSMDEHRRAMIHGLAWFIETEAVRLASQGVEWRSDFALTTRALVGGTADLIADWLHEADPVSLEALAEVVVNLYLAVIERR